MNFHTSVTAIIINNNIIVGPRRDRQEIAIEREREKGRKWKGKKVFSATAEIKCSTSTAVSNRPTYMLYTSTQGFLAITLKCAYGHWVFGCVWHYRCCVTIRRRFLRISKGICRSIYFTCTLIYTHTHTHADTLVHVIIHPWAVIVYQIQSVILHIYLYIPALHYRVRILCML